MRSEVTTWLENLDDSFVAAVHAMVGTYIKQQPKGAVFGYEADGQPKYARQMKARYDAEVRAALEEGAFITIEELERESEQW